MGGAHTQTAGRWDLTPTPGPTESRCLKQESGSAAGALESRRFWETGNLSHSSPLAMSQGDMAIPQGLPPGSEGAGGAGGSGEASGGPSTGAVCTLTLLRGQRELSTFGEEG